MHKITDTLIIIITLPKSIDVLWQWDNKSLLIKDFQLHFLIQWVINKIQYISLNKYKNFDKIKIEWLKKKIRK